MQIYLRSIWFYHYSKYEKTVLNMRKLFFCNFFLQNYNNNKHTNSLKHFLLFYSISLFLQVLRNLSWHATEYKHTHKQGKSLYYKSYGWSISLLYYIEWCPFHRDIYTIQDTKCLKARNRPYRYGPSVPFPKVDLAEKIYDSSSIPFQVSFKRDFPLSPTFQGMSYVRSYFIFISYIAKSL